VALMGLRLCLKYRASNARLPDMEPWRLVRPVHIG
jgi:hypothetical protein